MQKAKPIISVIVPAYNEELYLGKCLDSLIKQSLDKKDFELAGHKRLSTTEKYLKLIDEKKEGSVKLEEL